MAVLEVGPGKPHTTIRDGVNRAADGDTVLVSGGTYTNDYPDVIGKSITLQAVGPRVVMQATGMIPNGKGILQVGMNQPTQNPLIRIIGFDFVGARVNSRNGSGIRFQMGRLYCSDCWFRDCENGLLATPFVQGRGVIMLDRCELSGGGIGEGGQTHNIYIGKVNFFSLTNSYSHNATQGHLIKTRANNNVISNNRIYGNNGTGSYTIDCPNGGNLLFTNNSVQKNSRSTNVNMLCVSVNNPSGGVNEGNTCIFAGNTIINERQGAILFLNERNIQVSFTNNMVFGMTQPFGRGPILEMATRILPNRPGLSTVSNLAQSFEPARVPRALAAEAVAEEPVEQVPDVLGYEPDEEKGDVS